MEFFLQEIFENKLHEIETRLCSACNYTLQSQKGHTCWNGYRHVTNDDKYGYAFIALEELETSKIISKDQILLIKIFLIT